MSCHPSELSAMKKNPQHPTPRNKKTQPKQAPKTNKGAQNDTEFTELFSHQIILGKLRKVKFYLTVGMNAMLFGFGFFFLRKVENLK